MRILMALLLFVGAHFGMGALIPATDGRSSWLVPMANNTESWLPGLGIPGALAGGLGLLAVACFGLALLGLVSWLVRGVWIRPAILVGLASLIVAYGLHFTLWGLLPLCLAALALYVVGRHGRSLASISRRRVPATRRSPA